MKYIDPNWHLKNQERIIAELGKTDADGLKRGFRIKRCKECGLHYETNIACNKFKQAPPTCLICRCERSELYKKIALEGTKESWEDFYNRLYKKGLWLHECLKREYEVLKVRISNERITTRRPFSDIIYTNKT